MGFTETLVFNPLDVNAVNAALGSDHAGLSIVVPDASPVSQGLSAAQPDVSGIVYRLATPLFVQVRPDPTRMGGESCDFATPVAVQSLKRHCAGHAFAVLRGLFRRPVHDDQHRVSVSRTAC